MPREAACMSYCFTICFVLLIFRQSATAIPIFYSRKLTLRPDEFLLTFTPSSESQENWSGPLEDINSDYAHYLPFRRLTRNTGGDEARYQIHRVGDLPMFRFG